jgi:restriction system protein
MGITFRKSIRLGKFARINLSNKGISGISVGVRGARIGVNSRGTYLGASIPGTGLSAQHYLSKNSRTGPTYQITIENAYLGLQKVIKGTTEAEVLEKAEKQLEIWTRKEERERKKEALADLQQQFEEESAELANRITSYQNILKHTLSIDDRIDWEKNKMPLTFTKTINKADYFRNVPNESILELIFFWKKSKRLQMLQTAEQHYTIAQQEYDIEKSDYESSVREYNQELDQFKAAFESGDEEAVIEYVTKVLNDSEYLPDIVRDYEISYNKELKALLIDYYLPSPADVPNAKELKFVKTAKEIREVSFKKGELEEFYNSVIAQMTLRTIHEIFESVYTNAVETVVFNGKVETTNKATGQAVEPCIISLMTYREQFININLDKVNPTECLIGLNAQMILPFSKLQKIEVIATQENISTDM